jgi:hypothetical protein
LDVLERFADDMCGCFDAACAQIVGNELQQWSQEESKRAAERPKLSDEEMQRMSEIANRLGTCMQKAMSTPATGSGTP